MPPWCRLPNVNTLRSADVAPSVAAVGPFLSLVSESYVLFYRRILYHSAAFCALYRIVAVGLSEPLWSILSSFSTSRPIFHNGAQSSVTTVVTCRYSTPQSIQVAAGCQSTRVGFSVRPTSPRSPVTSCWDSVEPRVARIGHACMVPNVNTLRSADENENSIPVDVSTRCRETCVRPASKRPCLSCNDRAALAASRGTHTVQAVPPGSSYRHRQRSDIHRGSPAAGLYTRVSSNYPALGHQV